MTQELTPNTQITQANVGLLKAGYWVADGPVTGKLKALPDGWGCATLIAPNGSEFSRILHRHRFTYIGPDLGDGWIGWSGGENPVPGMRVEVRCEDGSEDHDVSDNWHWDTPLAPIIAFRPALSPPAEVPFAAEDACLACNSPTPVDHIGDATEKVDWARCQRCGGEIQGWICQDCHQEFEENDASELVFCPSEGVEWERVGPKLVEALLWARPHVAASTYSDKKGCLTAIDAALAATKPEGGA